MQPYPGDVVRSVDPFKLGTDVQRPWLVISTDRHPFVEEQFVAVAVSTKEYADSVPLAADDWDVGGVPEASFASPWAVHSPRVEDVFAWQGRVSDSILDRVTDELSRIIW